MNDKVSIIVPIYNCLGSLERCIKSITNQTYSNIEIIAVDDGSSDGSEELIDLLAKDDSRIMVFHNENQGVSLTRNFALKKATGKYIQFVDSDDFLPPYSTETMVNNANKTGADLIICDFYRVVKDKVSKKGKIKTKKVFSLKDYGNYMMKSPADFYYGVLWNKLYRKAIIDKNNLQMLADVNWCEDFLFNLEYAKYCNVFFAVQIPIYYYVKNENSLSSVINPQKIANMKYQTFIEYNNFYQNILSEEEYQSSKPKIYRYLVESATDGRNWISSSNISEENLGVSDYILENNSEFVNYYRYIKFYASLFTPLTHKYNLDYQQIFILDLLDTQLNISKEDLTNMLYVTKRQISVELQILEFKGFIKINGYKEDKVSYDISFSKDGYSIIMEIRKIKKDFNDLVGINLTEEEKDTYQKIRKKMDDVVKERLANIMMISDNQM